ncbi:ankyrin repeat domain-containing protein [Aquimarina sp. MMG016]|uniref:ankyrin repeat domain-containing protein n=1 Tax=Aquimarina sp. MMG016 TaxID=2822690 RepID=UPI0032B61536
MVYNKPPVFNNQNYYMDALFNAIRSSDLETIKTILDNNPNLVSSKDTRGSTPLLLAAYYGLEDVVKAILKYNPDINAKDGMGNTALMGVCFKGHYTIAKILIDAGADVNQKNNNNATALIYAATFSQKEIIILLLENAADINIRDNRGYTAEMHAKDQGLDFSELLDLTS